MAVYVKVTSQISEENTDFLVNKPDNFIIIWKKDKWTLQTYSNKISKYVTDVKVINNNVSTQRKYE